MSQTRAARASEPSHARRIFSSQAKRRVGGGQAGTNGRRKAPVTGAVGDTPPAAAGKLTDRWSLRRVLRSQTVTLLLALGVLGATPSLSSAEACPNEPLREAQHATALPDCRAYEMVSPPVKHGGDVMGNSTRTRAAASETPTKPMAVSFASLGGFADVKGMGVATEYLSERSTVPNPGDNGWSTHAITPPQTPLSLFGAFQGMDPLYSGDFSADLSSGVFRAWSALTDAPNVSRVENLYRVNDLRSPGSSSYQLLTDAEAPVGSDVNPAVNVRKPNLAGASADFSHVIFESRYDLTSDAIGAAVKLYEWADGTVRLVGILPDGTPAVSSQAGRGATNQLYTPRTISADGSLVLFTVPGFADPSGTDQIYMRDDHGTASTVDDSTVRVTASERTDCAADPTCGGNGVPDPAPDPAGTQSATYETASADGSRVFFTSSEQLTDDDTDSAVDLYMYDAKAPAGDHLTRLSVDSEPADPPNGVFGATGASADGRYVYFVSAGQLAAGSPTLFADVGIYLWHEGEGVSYVGKMNDPGRDTFTDLNSNWNLAPADARVTPDGKHLLFGSHSGVGLTGYDHNTTGCGLDRSTPCNELYVYSADTHELACASCAPSGTPATADAIDNTIRVGTGGASPTWHLSHAISDDGKRVFFSTREALAPQDTNGKIDAYEYDVSTGTPRLISSGTDPSNSYFMDASANGDDVFFLTRERFVGWDVDDNYDLYDARVGGGFPEPVPAQAPCSGAACQGQLTGPPGSPSYGSSLLTTSTGNAVPVSKVSRLSKSQKLKRALRACKSKRKKSQRKKCEFAVRRRFGKSGGSK